MPVGTVALRAVTVGAAVDEVCAPALLFLLVPASAARVHCMPAAARVAGGEGHSLARTIHEVEPRAMAHEILRMTGSFQRSKTVCTTSSAK